MKRRKFISTTAAGVIAPTLLGKFGVSIQANSMFNDLIPQNNNTDKVLIIIQLQGGNDGLNTLIPYDKWDELNAARPNIILPENDLLDLDGTDKWKLHPIMTGMRDLYDEGKLCALQSVGYPNQNGSHPWDTDNWLNGAVNTQPEYFTGWAGRFLKHEYPDYPDLENIPDHPPAIEIGDSQSLIFQEQAASMGILLKDPAMFSDWWQDMRNGQLDYAAVGSLTNPNDIEDSFNQAYCHSNPQLNYLWENNGIVRELVAPIIAAYDNATGDTPSGNNTLANKLSIISKLIQGGLQTKVYLVRHSSYDTHHQQLGYHNALLNELSTAIKQFVDECNTAGIGDRVLGMTISEFGRTIFQYGDGTSHGRASCMFLFGDNVAGGVLGDSPDIPTTWTSEEDDNIDMQFDIRQVYSTVLKHWFCVDTDVVESQILFEPFSSLPVITNSDCCTQLPAATITGAQSACQENTFTYDIPATSGASYYWEINQDHGTILNGQFTNQIEVQWTDNVQSEVKVYQIAE